MNFCRTFKIGQYGKTAGDGSLIISNGMLKVSISDNTCHIKEFGLLEDKSGLGVITEKDDIVRKTKYVKCTIKYNPEDLPTELKAKGYIFNIKAEKTSDNEYVFPFSAAKMTNKK